MADVQCSQGYIVSFPSSSLGDTQMTLVVLAMRGEAILEMDFEMSMDIHYC